MQDGTGRRVLDRISLRLDEGASISVVGESDSGKTTLALALLGAVCPGLHATDGEIRVAGQPILPAPHALQNLRRDVLAYLR